MKTDIDVTVIMSVYNCGKYLPEAIESILNQTFRKLEIVICDDCSKDNTFKVAMDYARRNPGRILVLRNGRNRGQAYARNRCIAKARGRYIAIMDGDDSCSPLRIEKEMAFLRANPAYDYVGTWMRLFDDKGFWGEVRYNKEPDREEYVRTMPYCAASCLFRKEALLAIGKYDEHVKYRRVEDFRMMLSLLTAGYIGYNLQEPLYYYREGAEAYQRRSLRYRFNASRANFEAMKELNLSAANMIHVIRPIAVGMVPKPIYVAVHRTLRRTKK